jgi:hypothetical protein
MKFIEVDLIAKITLRGKKESVIGFKTVKIITMGLDCKGNIELLIGLNSGGHLYEYRGDDLIDLCEYYKFSEVKK